MHSRDVDSSHMTWTRDRLESWLWWLQTRLDKITHDLRLDLDLTALDLRLDSDFASLTCNDSTCLESKTFIVLDISNIFPAWRARHQRRIHFPASCSGPHPHPPPWPASRALEFISLKLQTPKWRIWGKLYVRLARSGYNSATRLNFGNVFKYFVWGLLISILKHS